jgi:hypothetical protein
VLSEAGWSAGAASVPLATGAWNIGIGAGTGAASCAHAGPAAQSARTAIMRQNFNPMPSEPPNRG